MAGGMGSREPLGLKVGDLVAWNGGLARQTVVIEKVQRVTPTGRFTAGRKQWNADGTLRGRRNGWSSDPYECRRATEEDLRKARRQKQQAEIERCTLSALSPETIASMHKAMMADPSFVDGQNK